MKKGPNHRLRALLKQAWLLERDKETRSKINEVAEASGQARTTLGLVKRKLQHRQHEEADQQIDRRPWFTGWHESLEALRSAVAAKYFHDSQPARSDGHGTPTEEVPWLRGSAT